MKLNEPRDKKVKCAVDASNLRNIFCSCYTVMYLSYNTAALLCDLLTTACNHAKNFLP